DIARLVAEAGDRRRRTIRIRLVGEFPGRRRVAENDLSVGLEPGDRVRLGEVVALAVRNRYAKHLTGAAQSRERRVGLFDADVEVLAAELQAAVAQHRSRQKPGFKQDLEPV